MMNPIYISRAKFKKEYPKCFEEFLKFDGDRYLEINTAMDSFIFHIGIGIITPLITDKSGEKILGYKSIVKFYPQNKCRKNPDEYYYIEDYKRYKAAWRAYKATLIHVLDNLEDLLLMSNLEY